MTKILVQKRGGEERGGGFLNTPLEGDARNFPQREDLREHPQRRDARHTCQRDSGNMSSERHAGNTCLREAYWDHVVRRML